MAEPISAQGGAVRGVPGPVTRPGPLRHVVFDALVELIINRSLLPGEHLREAELAQQLGVSRQPVREALQKLHADGWVDLRPAQGAFVHQPTDKEADDLLATRTLLEAESARRAATLRTDTDIARLWELWKAGVDAVKAQNPEAMVSANVAFHDYLMSIADNSVLAELSALVSRRVRWYFMPIALTRGQDSWDEHAELIRAVSDGDQVRAGELMIKHTERTRHVSHVPEDAPR